MHRQNDRTSNNIKHINSMKAQSKTQTQINDEAIEKGLKVTKNSDGTYNIFEGVVNKIQLTIKVDRLSKNNVYLNTKSDTPVDLSDEFVSDYILHQTYMEKTAIYNKGKRKFAPLVITLTAKEGVIKERNKPIKFKKLTKKEENESVERGKKMVTAWLLESGRKL